MLDIQTIKEGLNILEIAAPLCSGLIKTGNCYQAKINPFRQETTSSLYFYEGSQRFHDFGTGDNGDVLDFYSKASGLTLKETVLALGNQHGRQSIPMKSKVADKKIVDFLPAFSRLEALSLKRHKTELEMLFPTWLINESEPAAFSLLAERLRFDRDNKTLAYSIKNQQGQILGIKRRHYRVNGQVKKWVASRGSEANHCHLSIRTGNEPVFILEGIKDGLHALLLGLDFIALPSANYKAFKQCELDALTGREVIMIADIDAVGIDCMQRLAMQIATTVSSYFILDVRLFLVAVSFDETSCFKPEKKLDFADAVQLQAKIGGKPLCGSFTACFKAQLLFYVNFIQSGE